MVCDVVTKITVTQYGRCRYCNTDCTGEQGRDLCCGRRSREDFSDIHQAGRSTGNDEAEHADCAQPQVAVLRD